GDPHPQPRLDRRGGRAGPRDPRGHHRGPRHPARRDRGRRGAGARADHPDVLRLPGDGGHPQRPRRAAQRRGLPPGRGRVRPRARLDHRLDDRRGPRQARGVRRGAARRPRRRGHPPDPLGALPAVRLARHARVQPLRLDRLQVTVDLQRLPRAVRPLQGHL
ncbi:MAG: 1,2-phenylacetyl-CoA epoxidase, subunit D, partial [uncultured Nocardioides sp.]